jgi:hypothetical protein
MHLSKESSDERRELVNQHIQMADMSNYSNLVQIVEQMYEAGLSAMDLIEWIRTDPIRDSKEKNRIIMEYHKIKAEYRCEKLLMLYLIK